ncbi:MAG TPA: helix-turn-helix domain-containing protein, partial [Polyangium sp.]|nr:helix-turn-helix domain-containing protein [Polyangium sp.]
LPWKPAIFGRVRDNLRGQRQLVMAALVRFAGPDGRCWVSMSTLAREAGVDIKTARRHVAALHEEGRFLRVELMTWARLGATMRAAGRPEPRKDNNQSAPYLYTVLDGHGRQASGLPEHERRGRPELRRASPPRPARPEVRRTVPEPKTRGSGVGMGYQLWEARGLPKLVAESSDPPDQNPKEGAESLARSATEHPTPLVSSSRGEGEPWREAWAALVETYGAHFRRVYEAPPVSPRGLKPDDPRECGEHLAALANSLAARLRDRFGVEHDGPAALRALADRIMGIWFAREGSNGYLKREAHPLRALCEELPGRAREACQAIVRDHKPKPPPRTERRAERPPSPPAGPIVLPMPQLAAGPLDVPTVRRPNPMTSARPPEAPAELGTVGDELRELGASPAPPARTAAEWAARFSAPVETPPILADDGPALAQEGPKDAPTRSEGHTRPVARRPDAITSPPRPLVRGGPRWGGVGIWPARVRHVVRPADDDEPAEGEPPPE